MFLLCGGKGRKSQGNCGVRHGEGNGRGFLGQVETLRTSREAETSQTNRDHSAQPQLRSASLRLFDTLHVDVFRRASCSCLGTSCSTPSLCEAMATPAFFPRLWAEWSLFCLLSSERKDQEDAGSSQSVLGMAWCLRLCSWQQFLQTDSHKICIYRIKNSAWA